jgi:anthranilate phosphoribosyltransferase
MSPAPIPPPFSITPLLEKLSNGQHLDEAQSRAAMNEIIAGRMPPTSLAALLTALRIKGEDESELAAFAATVRAHAVKVTAPEGALDTCGTGGDSGGLFNVSTATALVVAGMGIPVAKHGNRSVSSKTGSADVLKELGVNVDATPAQCETCLKEAGIAFLFAPNFHPGLKHAAPVRKELGVRTVFNLLGPLCNPALAKRQLLGVFHPKWCAPFARVLKKLGSENALVVCGVGAVKGTYIDEVSPFGLTTIAQLKNGSVRTHEFDAKKALGFKLPKLEALSADGAMRSADIITELLDGDEGPPREIVLLNAAAAAQAAGKVVNWKDGWKLAEEAVDSKRAKKALELLVACSNR